ncbi:hypothetical protein [Spirosoma pollinicola]|uniref:hypothetical protein n=1 Tax=Spirosoma pollinicola TaxID=2057025 RepID=UPI0012FD8F55|nr:hypothetical protein [Spirosoma pollinicola]
MSEINIPSKASAESLDNLSESFRPANVKYLLALDSQYSLQDCMGSADGMLKRLKLFVENNNSIDGIDHRYTSIKTYTPTNR